MSRSRIGSLLAVGTLFWCASALAQQRGGDSAYADRALVVMAHRASTDSRLGVEPGDVEGVVVLLDSIELKNLADSTVAAFLAAMMTTIDGADTVDCMVMLDGQQGGGSKGMLPPLRKMDSTTVDLWMTFFRRALHDRASGFAPDSTLSEEEGRVALLDLLARLDEKRHARMMGSMNSQAPAEQCWVIRTLYGEMARMPIEEAARVFRATQMK